MSWLLKLPFLIPYGGMVGKCTWYRVGHGSGAYQVMKCQVLSEICKMLLINQHTEITRERHPHSLCVCFMALREDTPFTIYDSVLCRIYILILLRLPCSLCCCFILRYVFICLCYYSFSLLSESNKSCLTP